MALSKEVLDTIAFSKQHGFDKLNLAPPGRNKERDGEGYAGSRPHCCGKRDQ
ncbi:acetyl esterase [Mucilaginibacter sp. OK098]|nr:acetyl esterase [Mucilaginibacter sp. OK098]